MNPLYVMALAALLSTSVAFAHGPVEHGKKAAAVKEQKDWGIGGDVRRVTRTVEMRMADSMRFTPDTIEVRQGDTIRFVVINDGKMMHEFVIGTRKENELHAALMVKFPNMEHDEPYMAHVGPGKRGEIVWTFNRAGEFEFACLIAGHYTAGMVGRVAVLPAAPRTPAKAAQTK
ncbi:MAG: cupredoxin family protein [Proteobacteria bacterium]|nr:cupredoxin family protein [Burkholderiales bacterium]